MILLFEMCRWLESIRDWCISRQLWWGHRIPAWYTCLEGEEGSSVAGTMSERLDRYYLASIYIPEWLISLQAARGLLA